MPLQLFKFTDLPLQFVILESCHCNLTTLQNMTLLTPSICFKKFMDQNSPSLLLPLILSFLSLDGQIPAAVAGSLPGCLPPLLVRGQALGQHRCWTSSAQRRRTSTSRPSRRPSSPRRSASAPQPSRHPSSPGRSASTSRPSWCLSLPMSAPASNMPSHADDVDDWGALTNSDHATPALVIAGGGVAAHQPVSNGRLDGAGAVAGRRSVVPVGEGDDVEVTGPRRRGGRAARKAPKRRQARALP